MDSGRKANDTWLRLRWKKRARWDDPYHLERFVWALEGEYQLALAEIRNGRKQSH